MGTSIEAVSYSTEKKNSQEDRSIDRQMKNDKELRLTEKINTDVCEEIRSGFCIACMT